MVVNIYMIYGVEMVVLPKTGGRAGGGRVEDSQIFVGSDQDEWIGLEMSRSERQLRLSDLETK